MKAHYLKQGEAAIRQRNAVEAERWFRKAVAADPRDAQALACLGQTLLWLGRRPDGLERLHAAGQALCRKAERSGEIAALLGLTEQLQHWNDFAGAKHLGIKTTQIAPQALRAWQLLALSHQQLNESAAALAAGRKAAALAPASGLLQILLASLELDAGLQDEPVERLRRVLAWQLNPEERYRAHKEMARGLDKSGASAEVFTHLHAAAEASRLIPAVQQQDAGLVPQMLSEHLRDFSPERLTRLSLETVPADLPAPVFVLGFMRSGTTLTQEVLGTHPALFIADETDLIMSVHHELIRRVPGSYSCAERLQQLDDAGCLDLRRYYWERARSRFGSALNGRTLVDKTTMNTVDLGLIHSLFPDAKVIFVMRDPLDVVLSCFMQTMVPTPSTVQLLELDRAARFYAQVMDWWLAFQSRMRLACLELRYEAAVTDFDTTFTSVFDFLGLAYDPAAREFHKQAAGRHIASPSRGQVAQPLYASSVARWQRYATELAPVRSILEPYRRAFAYGEASAAVE